jgi:hypothetical protein
MHVRLQVFLLWKWSSAVTWYLPLSSVNCLAVSASRNIDTCSVVCSRFSETELFRLQVKVGQTSIKNYCKIVIVLEVLLWEIKQISVISIFGRHLDGMNIIPRMVIDKLSDHASSSIALSRCDKPICSVTIDCMHGQLIRCCSYGAIFMPSR